MPKRGHCPVCNGTFEVTKATNPGDAGHREDNEAANYRFGSHIRKDIGGQCPNEGLPPDRLL
ncbi:MAG: hypothetical protein Q8P20_06615 [bacterium]|nr:hypothetical protein [bacterium]